MRWMMTLAGVALIVVLSLAQDSTKPASSEGVLPKAEDGHTLNFDFETGTLADWTVEGEAFLGQPIEGDTVFPRRNDNRSQHQGKFWVGGYEKKGDKPRGKLISAPFTITHPWASFLIGGGPHLETCFELVDKKHNEVMYRFSGVEEENLRRVAIDLQRHQGKEVFIRLVDNHTGHWGHINFDDFRFHSTKPNVPPRPNNVLKDDTYKYAGLKPEESAQVMTVPEGFEVKLFAGEPDVRQPIAMCMDDRGRIWVAEAFCYPIRRKDSDANDRIVIFEDVDGDGKHDKRTVFMEKLNLVSGIEFGFGGLWIGAAPYLMFVPIDASGDKPAGPPKILLDGWAYEDTHETLNTFCWGPDGWLYGCHGVFTHSNVGKPGASNSERTRINAGIWRYHPIKHQFEVFAHGTSNPWGLDYNEHGQFFIEACVIPHCFHIIQGGRYLRQAGVHFNSHTYGDIDTIADHRHYLGATPHGGNNKSDAAGGGHAHCGLMCYLGGTWPKEYHGQLFMGNIHGRRLNMDRLTRKGSGYVAGHGPDFLLANDAWARFINFMYGPDGNVYMIDWYDQQACHRTEPQIWDRTNGRIYKVCYRGTNGKETDLKKLGGDLSKLDLEKLLELQLHPNDWYVRHARRILQERCGGIDRESSSTAPSELTYQMRKLLAVEKDPTKRLRIMWAAHVSQNFYSNDYARALTDSDEHVRAWAIQLTLEPILPSAIHIARLAISSRSGDETSSRVLSKLTELAKNDPSPIVRLYLASSLQRMPAAERWDILAGLLSHAEDKDDQNLPHLYWYALEPLAIANPSKTMKLALEAKVPMLENVSRRLAAHEKPEAMRALSTELGRSDDQNVLRQILQGMTRALQGQRNVFRPENWAATYAKLRKNSDLIIRNQALMVASIMGEPSARPELLEVVQDTNASMQMRQNAVNALITLRAKELPKILQLQLHDPKMRSLAIRGLAGVPDQNTPSVLLAEYPNFTQAEKREAVTTLASRVSYAQALLTAVSEKKLPIADVPADVVRQLRNLGEADLDKRIAEVWGVIRNTPAERQKQIAEVKGKMMRIPAKQVDLSQGRMIYQKTCAQCHVLFGVGGKVGPDITGSNRANLDYLLENIYDASAVIPKDYAATFLVLKDGRSLTGIVKERNAKTVSILTATEALTIPTEDIDAEKPSEVSMMPDDQMKPFSDMEIRALIGYLQSPNQVPILATQENAKEFFNGKDLTGWDGDPKLWSVENGEIVGKSPGIKKNEFLKSHMMIENFRLKVRVKLTPNKENSGIQFRSAVLPNGDVKGYQADMGQGWWGKLYEEHGRELLAKDNRDQHVKVNDWNEYEIVAQGDKIKTYLNGQLCVDLDDPPGAKRGIIAFQIHSGGAMEVRFKDVRLEVLGK